MKYNIELLKADIHEFPSKEFYHFTNPPKSPFFKGGFVLARCPGKYAAVLSFPDGPACQE